LKIYIVCDLEGVAGVVDFKKQCMEEGDYYRQAIWMATQELNALIEGALEGGATEVYAWPGHGSFPGGIDVEALHPSCNLVMHAGDGGPVGMDESFDAMFLHGLHGMAGSGGVLSHSFYPFPRNIWLNELKIGEIAMNILTFSKHGIPTVFVSGDQVAFEEARELVPEIGCGVVKWPLGEKEKLGALSIQRALSLSPSKARELLREGAQRALSRVQSISTFWIEPPYELKVEYVEEKYAEMALKNPGVERLNEVTTIQNRDNLNFIF
jgi:D-amino peptidase